jgi:beta-glucanase (GH16 family)
MNNAFLKLRFRLYSTFGLIPSADSVEKKEKANEKEYNTLIGIQQSDEMARYEELRGYFHSKEFKRRKKEINAQKYKNSEPHKKEQRLKKIIKSEPVRTYLKVADSKDLQHFQKIKESSKWERFHELKEFFDSDHFGEFKKTLKNKRRGKKREYQETLKLYKKKKKKYNWFFRFKDSKEYSNYLALKDSDKLHHFKELKEEIRNTKLSKIPKKERKQRKKDLRESKKQFKALKKDPEIKNYLKIRDSQKLKKFNELKDSREINEFLALEEKVNSASFAKIPEEIENLKLINTKEFKNYQEYKKLKRDGELKRALRFYHSKKFSLYQSAIESELLKEYRELKDYIESKEFIDLKKYLKTRNKFKLSSEFKDLQEYRELKKSDNIRWYYKHVNSKKYDFQRKWERTFLDEFQGDGIDTEKWLTSYYWGKALLNESYVQATDAHFYTEGNNLELADGVLKIITKKEEAEGKVWHPNFGFYPAKFSYTSGIINTGQSFRQKYGLFRAKVKLTNASSLRHSFWLVPDKILPEIDIFHYSGNKPGKIKVGSYIGDPRNKESLKADTDYIRGPNFSKRFYIYSLYWKPDMLLWKINGITVKKDKKNIPQEPMFLVINSGLDDEIQEKFLPKEMQVDWVETFKER